MKTKQILTSILLVVGFAANAQVGINTQNPQGTFHVDGAKDNAATGAPTALQSVNDFLVTSTGNVGVGTATPGAKLEVNGASINSSAFNAGSSNAIDFSKSNLAYTTSTSTTITLNNIKNGGTYTLSVIQGASRTVTFTSTGFTVKFLNNKATVANKETLYTFIVMGTTVYAYVASGF